MARLPLLDLLLQLLHLLFEILDHLLQLLHQLLQHRLELLSERRCRSRRRCHRGVKLLIIVMASCGMGRQRCDRQTGDDRQGYKKSAGTKSRLSNMSRHICSARICVRVTNESLNNLKLNLPDHAERIVKRSGQSGNIL
jgi:hypothetical protein